MKRFVIYLATGEIIGHTPAEETPNVPETAGHHYLESATGEPDTHWVDGGALVEYSAAGMEKHRSRPPGKFQWNPSTEQWIDLRALADAQSAAWQAIKTRREVAFDARAVSSAAIAYSITKDKGNLSDRITSLQGAVAVGLADGTTTIEWRDRDDAPHLLTLAGLNLLAAEMGARGQAIYENSWALDAQVKAATTNAEVDSIDLEAGWP